MAHLAEFWIILESDLVENSSHEIFVEWIWKCYKTYYRLYSNQHIFSYGIWIYFEEVMTFLPKTPVLD